MLFTLLLVLSFGRNLACELVGNASCDVLRLGVPWWCVASSLVMWPDVSADCK